MARGKKNENRCDDKRNLNRYDDRYNETGGFQVGDDMPVWAIVLITIAVYQLIGFILFLIFDSVFHDSDNFLLFWCGGVAAFLVWFLLVGIRSIAKAVRKSTGVCIVQRKSKPDEPEYVQKLIHKRDYEDFQWSNEYSIVNRYPKKEQLKAGYVYTDKNGDRVIRGYELEFISKDELNKVKTEKNCYHCKYDGRECTDKHILCNVDIYDVVDMSKFELRK